MKTAAAYIRVSTDRQEELSPAAQKRELKKYAKNNGIVITEFFQDDGISGRKAEKRPEFQKMISLAKSSEHPYDYILVWKYSRFARNQEESIVYKSLLKKNDVDVVSITEPLIDGPFASLIERIIEWMDEYYSIRLSGDVKRGMTEKALRGGYQSAPPLGYQMNKEHIPEIYEPEAAIYREIKRLCLEQNTPTTIARTLNDAGYRTRRGNHFEARTVLYILKNPFYTGMVRWNRAKHGNYYENTSDDIIIAKGLHTPLCTQKEYERIQSCISRYTPGSSRIRRKPDTSYKHYLCGIMKCPICGHNLAYQRGISKTNPDKAYPYFVCYQYAKGIHRVGGNISVRRCEDALVESLQSMIESGAEAINFHPNPKKIEPSPLLGQYQTALSKVEQKEIRIRDAYIDGIDTKEEYRANKQRLTEERIKLEQMIAAEKKKCASTDSITSAEDLITRLKDVLQLVQNPDGDISEKYHAISSVIERIEYTRESDTFEIFYLNS
jgi:DNA invertase Pin-like site-specific DNA recombinase